MILTYGGQTPSITLRSGGYSAQYTRGVPSWVPRALEGEARRLGFTDYDPAGGNRSEPIHVFAPLPEESAETPLAELREAVAACADLSACYPTCTVFLIVHLSFLEAAQGFRKSHPRATLTITESAPAGRPYRSYSLHQRAHPEMFRGIQTKVNGLPFMYRVALGILDPSDPVKVDGSVPAWDLFHKVTAAETPPQKSTAPGADSGENRGRVGEKPESDDGPRRRKPKHRRD